MSTVGLRQLAMLPLAAGMIVFGALGLAKILTHGSILAAVLLGIAIILSFDAVRTINSDQRETP